MKRRLARTSAAFAFALAAGTITMGAVTARATVARPAAAVASSQLTGVACPDSSNCFAVGFFSVSGSGIDKTLIERWNGKTWSVVPSPNPAGAKFARLLGVACQSASSCFAVGTQFPTTGSGKTLIERWNGTTWSIVANPNPTATGANPALNGVSCTATACLAVGLRFITSSECCKTFAERWNGNAWSIVPTPNLTGSTYSFLNAVSCRATPGCFAVGGFVPGNFFHTLVELWNGTSFSVVPSANHTDLGEGDQLASVSCPSSTSCEAAGSWFLGGDGQPATLIERWNGTTWSIVTSHDPNRSFAELHGMSCVTATNCNAVGDYFAPNAPPPFGFNGTRTLIDRWNGTAWSIVASPNAGTDSLLVAVKCVNATMCFAAGHGSAASGAWKALIERWNGTTWKVVVNANP